MRRVAFFVVLLGLGMLIAPGVAQNIGVDSGVTDTLDPVGEAKAHFYCDFQDDGLCGPCEFTLFPEFHLHCS